MTEHTKIVPLALQAADQSIRIRPVRADDLSALQADCWSQRSLVRGRDLLRRILNAADRKRGLGIVVVSDNGLLGYGQMIQWTRCAEISDLIVAANFRGRGIGTAMIQHLIRAIQEPKPGCVEIGAAHSNPRALALYRRLGFQDSYSVELDLGQGKETVIYLRLVFSDYHPSSNLD